MSGVHVPVEMADGGDWANEIAVHASDNTQRERRSLNKKTPKTNQDTWDIADESYIRVGAASELDSV